MWLDQSRNSLSSLLSGLYIQRSELESLQNIWKSLDFNNDGHITQREAFRQLKILEFTNPDETDQDFLAAQDDEMLLRNQMFQYLVHNVELYNLSYISYQAYIHTIIEYKILQNQHNLCQLQSMFGIQGQLDFEVTYTSFFQMSQN
jgi:Ca2+-binding EF-hand superfamily protein